MREHDTYVLAGMDASPVAPDLAAIEVVGDRIGRTWSQADWRRAERPSRVMDLGGATVLPGIEDSHLHAYEYGRALTAVDVSADACPDLAALKDVLGRARPEGSGWIRGVGWDDTRLTGSGPNGQICASDLDDALPSVPAILSDVTGHQAVINSVALRLSGIDVATPNPSGGVIVRDESGRPTGLLRESAVALVNAAIPRLPAADKRSAIIAAQDRLLALGVTAVTDPGLGPGAATLMDGSGDLDAVAAYQSLAAALDLHLRVDVMLLFGGLGGTQAIDVAAGLDAWGPPQPMADGGHLGISQVKVFADGIPRSRTAWMSEPYDDCTHGHLTVAGDSDTDRVEELRSIVMAAASRGWQVGVHTTGDRASEEAVRAFVEQETRVRELRHYVIHGDYTPHASMRLMAANGVSLNANPGIRWMVGDGVAAIIGEERTAARQPLRTAWDLGVNVCSSSDAPVTPPDWRHIVAAAMTRAIRTDPGRTDGQRLSAREAILSMTGNAAWQSRAESWRGRVVTGAVADLAVLDCRVDWSDPWSITEAPVRATVVGGVLRHGAL
jgi:predicted amidohydrolase YtcJ